MGAGMKSCTLLGPVAGALQVKGQVDHGRQIAAGMAGHEIGDQVLLLSGGGRRLAELLLEGGETLDAAACASAAAFPDRRVPGPPSAARPYDAGPIPRCRPALRRARSMRTPEATKTCFTPGCCRASLINSISGP